MFRFVTDLLCCRRCRRSPAQTVAGGPEGSDQTCFPQRLRSDERETVFFPALAENVDFRFFRPLSFTRMNIMGSKYAARFLGVDSHQARYEEELLEGELLELEEEGEVECRDRFGGVD